jgi:hypothetical protein
MPGTAVRWEAWRLAGAAIVPAAPLYPITFPATPLTARVEIALGADPAADPATWSWLDITQWVRYKDGINISRGRPDETGTVDPGRANLRLDNRDGRFSRRNPNSPYHGLLSKNTPIRIGVDAGSGVLYRFHGFINEWPTRWADKNGSDTTVPIVAAGVLRRLGKEDILMSALRYSMGGFAEGDFVPWTYHPGEDDSGSGQYASAVPAFPAAMASGSVSFGSYSGVTGSKPLPVLNATSSVSAMIPAYEDEGTWQIQFTANVPSAPSADAYYLDMYIRPGSGSPVVKARLSIDVPANTWVIEARDSSDNILGTPGFMPITYGQPFVYDVTHLVLGGTTYIHFGQFDENGFVQECYTVVTGGVGKLWRWIALANSDNAGWSFGHAAVYTDVRVLTIPNITPNARAITGHTGEMAHERMIRLSREKGIAFHCTSADSARMGPQAIGTYLDNIRACETADMGVLYEHEFSLGYQSLDDRLNAPVAMALDFDAGHIAEPPEPADDDQRLTNRVTASRSGGSSTTVEDADSIARDGLFQSSVTTGVETDGQTAEVAGWRVHLGTVDEDRWPSIALRFNSSPDLIPTWNSLPFGSRITIANPLEQVAPDALDLVIEGWTERLNNHLWEVDLSTSPATPYQVGVYATGSSDTGADVGYYGADTLQLTETVTSSATKIYVYSDPVFTDDTDDFTPSIRMMLGGEELAATAIQKSLSDLFGRVEVDTWGDMSTTGETYTLQGPDADFDVDGSRGTIAPSGINSDRIAYVTGHDDGINRLAWVRVQFDALPASGTLRAGMAMRMVDASNFWAIMVSIDSAGALTLRSDKRVDGTLSNVGTFATGITLSVATDYTLLCDLRGDTMSVMVYKTSDTQPLHWHTLFTDTDITTGSLFGAYGRDGSASATHTFSYDVLQVLAPQRITVTRSVNGVVKSHDPTDPAELDIVLLDNAIYVP